jgi:hypothetical protein
MRWSLEFFEGLPADEQQAWLAYDQDRQAQIAGMIERAKEPTNEDGTVSAEVLAARVLLALLHIG